MELIAEPSGQIRFKLIDEATGEIIYDELSAIIKMSERIRLKMAFGWGDGGVTCRMNGTWVLASKNEHDMQNEVQITGLKPPEPLDMSKENDAAKKLRESKLQSFRATDRKKERRDDEEAIKALRDAVEQLRDAVQHVQSGEVHYVEQVVSILRKLIATGDPLPLLQLVASMKGQPLTVYDDMEEPIGIEGTTLSMKGVCWNEFSDLTPTSLDLDVWLNSKWGGIDKQSHSHRDAIAKLGNTIGAHFSMDKWPIEKVLKAASSEFGGVKADYLVRYLLEVAGVAIELSSKMLAEKK
jgi:hypothetical protein